MTASAAVQAVTPLTEASESFEPKVYLCPAGVWTIGWGSTFNDNGTPVTEHTPPITLAAATARLQKTLSVLEGQVRAAIHVPVTNNEVAALIDFAYNDGFGALKGSTLLRLLNEGQKTAAAGQFAMWVHGGGRVLPGLVKRAVARKALFVKP